jgi:hypothetical protein
MADIDPKTDKDPDVPVVEAEPPLPPAPMVMEIDDPTVTV